ncbi:MAG: type II toxin-antitoxin system RelE/ParE family toxin [Proteobacteria bacterium]|nr:type II toxin-antitoxin system RelE/ParE family toxin [Pseudomonadota bacterium]MBS0464960.1 type II toxin-antitoxin system RelE/ParE family toxin [Pseudomonadota bacterium]
MAGRQVRWSQDAERDLDAIVGYIAHENAVNALRILDRLHARARSLASLSTRGRRIPELAGTTVPPLRELIEGPWRILYAIDGATVLVVAVVDSRRNIDAWFAQRFASDFGHE